MRVILQLTKWLTVLVLVVGLGATILYQHLISAQGKDHYKELQLFTKVLNLVQQYYVEDVDATKLIYGGIRGMLDELDPHTNFLPPDIFKEFESETSGEFGGIGIEITIQKSVLTVISPIEDTPAFEAGIKEGDRIVSINGESTKGLSLAEAAQKMKGAKGTKIRLGIFRDGFDEPKDFTIQRGSVKIKSAKYTDLGDGYGYVKITSFIENTYKEVEKILKDHETKAGKISGLVIDLRRNPGGLLDQAVKISDMFLDGGTIVSTIGRNQKEKEVIYAKKPDTRMGFPIIVLINEYSASASEILAGALRDNRRALVMGRKSFGKGSVQSVVKLGDGSALKLTVARYYTPNGTSIQSEGIVPDIELENFDAEALRKSVNKESVKREADIKGHLLSDNEKKRKSDKPGPTNFWWTGDGESKEKLSAKDLLIRNDFQIQQAYNYMKAWRTLDDFKQKPPTSAASQ